MKQFLTTFKILIAVTIFIGAFFIRSAFADTPINYGEAVTGSISVRGESDRYFFTASANDAVTIRATSILSALLPRLELYAPDGSCVGDNTRIIDRVLATAGTYTILIRDEFSDDTGDYALIVQKLNSPCNATVLSCGQPANGSISFAGPWNFYTFSASAYDKVTIRAVTTSGHFSPYLELYTPEGRHIISGIQIIDSVLVQAGTYTVVVSEPYNDRIDSYVVIWQKLNIPCNVIPVYFGMQTSGSIADFAEIKVYYFSVNSGDKITVCSGVDSQTSGDFDIYLELYDASGTLLAYGPASLKYTFANSGTFYLFVTDYHRNGTGSYKFILSHGDISCSGIDLESPRVSLSNLKRREVVDSGLNYTIAWASSDNVGITSQEIRLSTDSGVTYPTVIASGLGESIQFYNWSVPSNLSSAEARIKITALDAAGNQGEDASDADFLIIKTVLPGNSLRIDFSYDNLNRVTNSTSTSIPSSSYAYDALGNRLSLDITGTTSSEINNSDEE